MSAIVSKINAVTLSDGTTAFAATYPTTGGAATDRVFGAVAGDTAAIANTSVSGYMNSSFSAATRAKGTLTLAAGGTLNLNTAGTFAFSEGGGGVVAIKANSPTVAASTITFADTAVKGAEGAAYLGTTLTVSIAATVDITDSSSIQEIIDAINTDGNFTATLISGDAAAGFFAHGAMPANITTTAASVDIKATSLGDTADNVKITLHNDATAAGQETAVYDALKKTLDVHVHATSTMAQMVAAINASTDATTGAATNAWKATNLNPTVTNNGAFSVMPAAFYTATDSVSVESLNAGANFNSMQIQFQTVASLSSGVKALASYDEANNTFTIQVKNSEAAADAVTLQDISDAISAVDGFAGSFVTKNAAAGVSQSSARIFGKAVDTTAIGNTGSTGGNALLADLAVEIGSSTGQQVFTFKAGSTANQVASAINVVSDAIGVVAYQDNALLDMKSAAYGAKAFISVNVVSEGAGGQFKRAASALRATGTDADAKINGVQATANGNELSINSSSLAMTMNMQAETNGNFRFNITGGGAQFQLGPDVVSNQQLRIGIQSVNTARMGGVDGKLYQLASGGSASLINNATLAAKIADQAINTVTSLRGRLGAIQGLTMDTNQRTLEDMVQNMQTALSQIQDTDFAAETANLTRAQILTQSGMAVLSIANQAPQQVLSLLPRG
jgi:flagellin